MWICAWSLICIRSSFSRLDLYQNSFSTMNSLITSFDGKSRFQNCVKELTIFQGADNCICGFTGQPCPCVHFSGRDAYLRWALSSCVQPKPGICWVNSDVRWGITLVVPWSEKSPMMWLDTVFSHGKANVEQGRLPVPLEWPERSPAWPKFQQIDEESLG